MNNEMQRNRRNLLKACGAVAGSMMVPALLAPVSAALHAAERPSQPAQPERDEFILRGGYVLTMDSSLGEFPVGDVHVKGGAIVAVAARVDLPNVRIIDASRTIVMPGFVDASTHVDEPVARLPARRRSDLRLFPEQRPVPVPS